MTTRKIISNSAIAALCAALGLMGCSRGSSAAKISEVGPRISAGYYTSDSPEGKNVPAVSIQIADGTAETFSFLWYQCENKLEASFHKTGVTFSERPSTAPGPTVVNIGKTCDIKAEFKADSETTIQVNVTVNGTAQAPYTLSKVAQDVFAESIKTMAAKADTFSAEDEACRKTLGSTCKILELESK